LNITTLNLVQKKPVSSNWRDQFNAQLKAQVAGEMEGFFGPLSVSINDLSIFAQSLVDVVNQIQGGCSVEDASFWVGYRQGQQSRFLSAQNHIVQASSEVHRFIGRNYNVLSSGWGVLPQMQLAASALKEISEAIWIRLPVVDVNHPQHIQAFINQVNIAGCLRLVKACEDNSPKLAGLTGGIRGYLLAPIVGFNFAMFANLVTNAKEFRRVIGELYQKVNRGS
jgi:hypothetical protein